MSVSTINLCAINSQLFILEKGAAPLPASLSRLGCVIDELKAKLSCITFRSLPLEEVKKITLQVNQVYRLVMGVYKESPIKYQAFAKKLLFKVICLKLGGKIEVDTLLDPKWEDLAEFILMNHLHHKYQAVRLQMPKDIDGSPLILVSFKEKEVLVSWRELEKKPLSDDKGKISGFEFYHGNELLFDTDIRLRLSNSFIVTHKGITKYNPLEENRLIPFDWQDPVEWNHGYLVEVWTLLKDRSGHVPTIGVGDHCHVILKSANGDVYSIGKFSTHNQLTFKDWFSLFGRKFGRFSSPDIFVYFSEDTRHFDKVTIRISKEQFEQIIDQLSMDNKDMRPVFSLLKNNCASYIQGLLRKVLDLQVDSSIFLPAYLVRACLSLKVQKRILLFSDRLIQKLPSWMKKGFYFLPPIYLPTIIIGVVLKLFGLKNKKGIEGADLSMKDIFISPWNIYIHHPIALRESLHALSKNQDNK